MIINSGHRRCLIACIAAVFLAGAWVNELGAEPILVTDLRFVSASISGPFVTDTRVPDVSFAPFNATAYEARTCAAGNLWSMSFQSSSVTPTHFAGSGGLSGSASGCEAFTAANSALDIVFELNQPFRYVFSGLLTSEGGFAELVTGFGGERGFGERGALSSTGTLAPGRYEFIMEGFVEGPAVARWSVDLKLSPVPEPGSMLLLGAGIAFALRRRSRA